MPTNIQPLPTPGPFVSRATTRLNQTIGAVNDLDARVSALEEGQPTGGGTYEQFTICNSGTPDTRWIETHITNPTP